MSNVGVIRPPNQRRGETDYEHIAAVAAETVDCEKLALQLVRIQPGVRSRAHYGEHEFAA